MEPKVDHFKEADKPLDWEKQKMQRTEKQKGWNYGHSPQIYTPPKKIVIKCCEQLYSNDLDNTDETDEFLKTHKPPKPTREMQTFDRPGRRRE